MRTKPPTRLTALSEADAVFVGGGSAFRLLQAVQRNGLLTAIGARVRDGMPYLGVSAGANLACPTIRTTNGRVRGAGGRPRSFVAIAEWAADADQATLDGLGITGAVPCESTFRRVLQSLDADALDGAARAWAQQRTAGRQAAAAWSRSTAMRCNGSGTAGEPGRHLLAALDHDRGVVLGQVDVQATTNEIPMFEELLDRIDLARSVVTADAMHAQRAHATYLAGQRRADYLITAKRNQPGLHAQLAAPPWRQIPAADIRHDRAHGRAERRSPKVTAVAAGIAFPHAAQASQVVRRRRPLTGKNPRKWPTETIYAVTSLTVTQASPAQLAAILRGHWSIEDSLHWGPRRDLRRGPLPGPHPQRPRVMASLRNLAITILRLAGHASISAALRHHSRRPGRSLQTIMNS